MAKLTTAIQLRMDPTELAALDAYCMEGRRVTGEKFARTEVIRLAIAKLVASQPKVRAGPIGFDRQSFGEAFERLGHGGNPFADPEPIEERTIEPDPDHLAFKGYPMVETNITVDDAELARIRARLAERPTDFPAKPPGQKTKGKKA